MSPTHQDLSNDTTFSQIKSRVPVPLSRIKNRLDNLPLLTHTYAEAFFCYLGNLPLIKLKFELRAIN